MTTADPSRSAPAAPRGAGGARITLTLAALGMLGPFTINTIFPAFAQIGGEFGASDVVLQQLISVYLASFAVMSVFHGPLSDALGRKPVMLTGLAIYILAMFGAVLASGMGMLIALRVLQGVSAGAATIVSRVVIRDLFEGAEAQRLMARVMMIFALSPVIAPMLGGWLMLLGDWRWVFAGVGLYGVLVLVLTALMPESLPREQRIPLRIGAVLGSLWEVGRSLMMVRIALATAFGFAAHFVFVAAAPIVVVRLLGLGEQDFWVLFGPLILGMMAGSFVVGRVAESMDRSRLITLGFLGTLITTVLNLVVVMLVPAPSGGLDPSLIPVLVGPMLMTFTASLFFAPMQLEILDLFPHQRGAAASLGTFFTLVMNALLSGVVAPLVTGSLTVLALAALGYVVVGALLWGWHLLDRRRLLDAL
ncbi:Bcr/CflA family efflux MFS transporter [Brachybacterium sp. J153]|uniref:Bcr/CflA family efflux MFS transporter n=1 Tax=Brachybacterium sp. J153 TaxID=3116488 RepID=UPI002E7721FC|nr:Bcr/CflA family efflux MFS transporter [Brachybacterium sp. J153]MEE1617435.1 Bcr/CflA family efflux MFS transporter [Brachybacterium sp. J153]